MADLEEELYKFNPWWEKAYHPDFIPRPRYAAFLQENTENRDIIIVTGLRRVGKTCLMKNHIATMLKGMEPRHIFYASMDSLTLDQFSVSEIIREYRKIQQLKLEERVFLFLDEVVYRDQIHRELKNLYDSENVKIFATSSSASILRDTGAMLTGRSRILEVLPLDFKEYLSFRDLQPLKAESYLTEQYFEEYMNSGGMPEYILTGDISYLDNLVDSVIYKDIMAYYGVRDTTNIRHFFRLLMERAGKQFSINKVSKVMGLSADTIRRYLDYFSQTYLIYPIERCGKLNERLRAPKKLYAADVGMRNFITGFRDKGAIFENLVFIKLKHLNPCYVYQNGIELDFLIDSTLIEVKYGQKLTAKQDEFFTTFPAKKRFLIDNTENFLHLEDLL